jgi:serine protease
VALSSVNGLRVRVTLSVGGGGAAADVGVIYVLLYDAVLTEVVAQFTTAARQGNYHFEFSNIPHGQYEIVAGSDADNDLFICDSGEACGAWLTVDRPILIELDADTHNINFPIEYLVSLPSILANTRTASGTRRALPRSGKAIAKPR